MDRLVLLRDVHEVYGSWVRGVSLIQECLHWCSEHIPPRKRISESDILLDCRMPLTASRPLSFVQVMYTSRVSARMSDARETITTE